jgi:hypothetical protein
MANIDLSQLKGELSALKKDAQARKAQPSKYFSPTEAAFRHGIESRRKAFDLLANVRPPYTPTYIKIDTAFLIWPLRYGSEASNILYDSHIEPLNNWAKIFSSIRDSEHFLLQDELNFYFLWQNETGQDAVVNVESYLMLNGRVQASASSGWLWSPFWGEGTIGNSHLSLDVGLSLLEWWNQPPTHPVGQAGQLENVQTVDVDGGFALGNPGHTTTKYVSGDYHVNYDTFLIPRDGAAVFEVSLIANYEGYDGSCTALFNDPNSLILCPYLQLELMTAPVATAVR